MEKGLRGGRVNRINPMIQQIISDCFLNSSDPTLNKATVTLVSTSPDLKKTTVLVSSLENNKSSLNQSLSRSKQKIQPPPVRFNFSPNEEPNLNSLKLIEQKIKDSRK